VSTTPSIPPVKTAQGKGEYFVDLTYFPTEFASEDQALTVYNGLGLQYHVQFKKLQLARDETGQVVMFTLCCHRRAL